MSVGLLSMLPRASQVLLPANVPRNSSHIATLNGYHLEFIVPTKADVQVFVAVLVFFPIYQAYQNPEVSMTYPTWLAR